MRYLLIVLILTGCARAQQYRADAMIWRDSALCDRLGYVRDSAEWKQCIVDQARRK